MNQLIKIETKTIGNEEINSVNARELHEFLEVGKDFSTWIKSRIEQYDFSENDDYISLPRMGEQTRGGQNKIDYIISLDMAKELSMVEKNDKGKEARKYFIECEKIAKQQAKPMSTLELMAYSVKILQEQEAKVLRIEAEQRDMSIKQLSIATKQVETDNKIRLIEAKVTTSNSDYYSVSGYASLKGHRHLDVRRANLIGRLAAKLSREYDIEVGKVKDERYGHVNTYHIDILNEAFNRRI